MRAGFADHGGGPLRMQGAAALVDVPAVGLHGERDDLRAQLLEDERAEMVGRAVRAIDHHLESIERKRTHGILDELDVAAGRVVDADRLADGHGLFGGEVGSEDQALDLEFEVIRQLEAVRAEDLEPVVLERIVRRGQHDARHAVHGAGEVRDRGGGHGADQQHRRPLRHQPAGERRLQHVPGEARILADDDLAAPAAGMAQRPRDGPARLQRHFRRDGPLVGPAADPVCSEEFFHAHRNTKKSPVASIPE